MFGPIFGSLIPVPVRAKKTDDPLLTQLFFLDWVESSDQSMTQSVFLKHFQVFVEPRALIQNGRDPLGSSVACRMLTAKCQHSGGKEAGCPVGIPYINVFYCWHLVGFTTIQQQPVVAQLAWLIPSNTHVYEYI